MRTQTYTAQADVFRTAEDNKIKREYYLREEKPVNQ